LAPPKHKFYDTTLDSNVGYAKHAISIDENPADFKLVGWSPTQEKQDKRDEHGNLYFEQVWFPAVHADIGGGLSGEWSASVGRGTELDCGRRLNYSRWIETWWKHFAPLPKLYGLSHSGALWSFGTAPPI
jgi:hypothetical protein